MWDVEAISDDKLDRLKPCVCGCRSFHLDEGMNWQCSRCNLLPAGAIRFELDDEPPPPLRVEVTPNDSQDSKSVSSAEETATRLVLQRLEQNVTQLLSADAAIALFKANGERLKSLAGARNRPTVQETETEPEA